MSLFLWQVIVSMAMAGLSIEMANNPPQSRSAKWIWRSLFIGMCTTIIILSYVQEKQNVRAQQENDVAHARELQQLKDATAQEILKAHQADLDAINRAQSDAQKYKDELATAIHSGTAETKRSISKYQSNTENAVSRFLTPPRSLVSSENSDPLHSRNSEPSGDSRKG